MSSEVYCCAGAGAGASISATTGVSTEESSGAEMFTHFSEMEKQILTAKPCDWFRDEISANQAMTLAYGNFTKKSFDSEEEILPGNDITCCWSEVVLKHLGIPVIEDSFEENEYNIAVFDGICIYTIHSKYSRKNLREKTKLMKTPSAITKIWDSAWEKYDSIAGDFESILPETYAEFIQPKVLELLEKKHKLSGGHWYLLPSGCYCCT
jgi:hypothetical protein